MKYQQAYSLVELLMVLVISTALLSAAAPNLARVWATITLRLEVDRFIDGLDMARRVAVASNSRITVCGDSASTECTSDRQWKNGVLVFRDTDHDRQRDTNELILARIPLNHGVLVASKSALQFNTMGGGDMNGWEYCPNFGLNTGRRITVTLSGLAQSRETPCP